MLPHIAPPLFHCPVSGPSALPVTRQRSSAPLPIPAVRARPDASHQSYAFKCCPALAGNARPHTHGPQLPLLVTHPASCRMSAKPPKGTRVARAPHRPRQRHCRPFRRLHRRPCRSRGRPRFCTPASAPAGTHGHDDVIAVSRVGRKPHNVPVPRVDRPPPVADSLSAHNAPPVTVGARAIRWTIRHAILGCAAPELHITVWSRG